MDRFQCRRVEVTRRPRRQGSCGRPCPEASGKHGACALEPSRLCHDPLTYREEINPMSRQVADKPWRCPGVTRRSFLADTGMGFTGLALGAMLAREESVKAAGLDESTEVR